MTESTDYFKSGLGVEKGNIFWDEAPVVLLRLDDQGAVVVANQYAAQLTGRDLSGCALDQLFVDFLLNGQSLHLQDLLGAPDPIKLSVTSTAGIPIDLQFRFIRQADNSALAVGWHDMPTLMDLQQRLLEINSELGHFTRAAFKDYQFDVDRKEEDHRRLLEAAGEGILGFDVGGLITVVNPAAASLLGYTPGELIGQPASFVWDGYPATLGRSSAVECPVYRTLADGLPISDDQGFLRDRNGHSFPVTLTSHPVIDHRRVAGVVVTFFDISKQRSVEGKLRDQRRYLQSILDHVPSMIGYWDRDLRNRFGNYAYHDWLGIDPDKMPGMHIRDVIGEERYRLNLPYIEGALRGEPQTFERCIPSLDGSGVRYSLAQYLPDIQDGEVKGFFALVSDISSTKSAELALKARGDELETLVDIRTKDLNSAKLAAENANKTKDTFLANVSHELRTPLNAVIGMAGLALDATSSPKVRDYLEKIVRSGRHLNRLVNDLLDLSKMAAGRMNMENIPFSLRLLIEDCRNLMAPSAADKGLDFIVSLDEALPNVLIGDPHRLQQIVLNLIGNAFKFTSSGSVAVSVRLQDIENGRANIDIDVTDTGIGMSAAQVDLLFKPFAQGDASVSRVYGGTGLGLTISRQLAELMGGALTVDSREGNGSTFRARISCEVGTAEMSIPLADVSAGAPVVLQQYVGTRALVVDDQPLNIEIVEAYLAKIGIEVQSATDGRQALDVLESASAGDFDLILMDVQMPVMDGLEATRAIRLLPAFRDVPVIALTAQTMTHEKHAESDAGMSDHIPKPFDESDFFPVVTKWLPKNKCQVVKILADDNGQPCLNAIADLDAEAGLARFRGKVNRYLHWLRAFDQSGPKSLERIQAAYRAGDTETAAREAHAFKGSTGMLGMTAVYTAAGDLERALRDGASTEFHFKTLESAVAKMRGNLSAVLAKEPTEAPSIPSAEQCSTPLIEWSDRFSVGVPELDNQHQRLISIINRLNGCDRTAVCGPACHFDQTLSELIDYAERHFKAEEDYMASIGFDGLLQHEDEHRVFHEKMVGFCQRAADPTASQEHEREQLMEYLKLWLTNHILKSDMCYRDFARTMSGEGGSPW